MAEYTESSADEMYDADADATQVMDIDTEEPKEKVEEKPTPGEIKYTKFSVQYRSKFTLMEPNRNERMTSVLKHAPCSYTCTAGIAPSLLELKQHAHDLIAMIKGLTISTMPGVVDGINAATEANSNQINTIPKFEDGETFDFLNDLTAPYEGPRKEHPYGPALKIAHEQPLTALLNVLEEKNIPQKGIARPAQKIRNICPLHRVADLNALPPTGQSLPYAQHQALIQHANEILELLDHEYSAKGGLLSILPPKDQTEDREKAEATLLGQMILYTQRLVQRVHDLERLYANAMDVMAGEAIVPHQALSRLGPDGRSGREMVYPQDRFVLVNAGEDVWNHLSNEFDKKDKVDEIVMDEYRKLGVTGEMIWEKRGGQEMDRGITAIDVNTRYYRLRGTEANDPKTIFVIPAWEKHPGAAATRDMERTPSVVSVVKPVWPERASLWEQKHRSDLDDLKKYRAMAQNLDEDNRRKTQEITALRSQYELRAGELRKEKEDCKHLNNLINDRGMEAQKQARDARAMTLQAEKKAEALFEEAKIAKEQAKAEWEASAKERREAAETRKAEMDHLKEQRRQQTADYTQRLKDLEERDLQAGQNQRELAKKLRAAWQEQIDQTQILIEQLKKGDKPNMVPMGLTAEAGKKVAMGATEQIFRENEGKDPSRPPTQAPKKISPPNSAYFNINYGPGRTLNNHSEYASSEGVPRRTRAVGSPMSESD